MHTSVFDISASGDSVAVMPRLVISVSEAQKEVWVVASHEERVSLSEWIRRAGDARAELGLDAPLVPVPRPGPPVPFPTTTREFRPDPKKKP